MSNTENIKKTDGKSFEVKGVLLFFKDLELLGESLEDPAEIGTLLMAVAHYAETGDITKFEKGEMNILFKIFKQNVDMNVTRYNEMLQKRSQAGKEGADKRWANRDKQNKQTAISAEDNDVHIENETADIANVANDSNAISAIANVANDSNAIPAMANVANDGNEWQTCLIQRQRQNKRQDKDIYKNNNIPPSNPPEGEGGERDGGGYSANFEEFWNAYPKKVGKKAAYAIFRRLKVTHKLLDTMLETLKWQKSSADWKKNNGQFIPHPATWLNQGRWEDKPPGTVASAERYAKADEALLNGGNPFDFL